MQPRISNIDSYRDSVSVEPILEREPSAVAILPESSDNKYRAVIEHEWGHLIDWLLRDYEIPGSEYSFSEIDGRRRFISTHPDSSQNRLLRKLFVDKNPEGISTDMPKGRDFPSGRITKEGPTKGFGKLYHDDVAGNRIHHSGAMEIYTDIIGFGLYGREFNEEDIEALVKPSYEFVIENEYDPRRHYGEQFQDLKKSLMDRFGTKLNDKRTREEIADILNKIASTEESIRYVENIA